MKIRIYFLLFLVLPAVSFASNNDFSYDKNALADEFNELNKVSTYVDETKVFYHELSNSHVFEGKIELTNTIALKPNLKFEDMDWGAFAWGFCCWPIGIFTVVINDEKDKNSKHSYIAGIASRAIATGVVYVAYIALIIGVDGGFTFF